MRVLLDGDFAGEEGEDRMLLVDVKDTVSMIPKAKLGRAKEERKNKRTNFHLFKGLLLLLILHVGWEIVHALAIGRLVISTVAIIILLQIFM